MSNGPQRVRDLCRDSVKYLVSHALISSYVDSGRFVKDIRRSRPVFRPEVRLAAHYCTTEGPLYETPDEWGKVFRYIRSFTASGVAGGAFRVKVPRWCGSFGERKATDLLHLVSSAMVRCGFEVADKNEIARTARFDMKENSKVLKLPEPYGKYLHLQQAKPSWEEPVDLRLVVDCRAVSVMEPAGSKIAFQTYLDLELSAMVPPLLPLMGTELARLLGKTFPGSVKSQDEIDREILRMATTSRHAWR